MNIETENGKSKKYVIFLRRKRTVRQGIKRSWQTSQNYTFT